VNAAGQDAPAVLWSRRVSGRQYLAALRILQTCPPLLQSALVERYAAIAGPTRTHYPTGDGRCADTWNDADADLRRTGRELRHVRPATAFDDDAIERAAKVAAHHCLCAPTAAAIRFAESQGLTLPAGPRVTAASLRRRLVSCDWWRRRLRTMLTRQCEELFRRLGFVKRQASPYISGDALARVRQAQAKGRRWMRDMLAVAQDTGESIPLAHIAARSLSNPTLRRGELMLRARGFQETAEALGHRCLMMTATCPSAFHPWLRQSGDANPRYNNSSPREAQKWLNVHWARARAALKRRGVLYYGIRACEPHHDGTPHWHAVLYTPPECVETVKAIIGKSWLRDHADEPGAAEHRVRFTDEDPAKGSGVGYLAKYISKNIDGHGNIGGELSDESGAPVADDAERVVAWARVHGLRQFQQLGGPAVGCWRELRRVREPCEWEPLEALRLCTDHTDQGGPSWSRFVAQLGGIAECLAASRALLDKAEPRKLDRQGRNVLRITRWGELPASMVVGLKIIWRDRIRRLATRVRVWVLIFAPSGALGPVALTVLPDGAPEGWTNPQETSQAPPYRCTDPQCPACHACLH
jgi:hypothetical protein